MWWQYMYFVHKMGMPTIFYFSQLFTLGESNISDFALMFQTPGMAWVYYSFNTILIALDYPLAVTIFSLFWWVYLIQFFLWVFE
jgi:hypothetical protein